MNQTNQFIEVFVRCRPHKMFVHCGQHEIHVFDCFELYNMNCTKPHIHTFLLNMFIIILTSFRLYKPNG